MQFEVLAKKYFSVVFFILLLFSSANHAQAQDRDTSIESQRYKYEIGKFSECYKSIKQCLAKKSYNKFEDRVEAYRIIAKCYLAIDSVATGERYIDTLIGLKEEFEPDFDDPDRFKKAYERVRLWPRNNTVSSVSKTNEPLELAPATTAIITQEQIRQRGYNDLIEVLKDLPGFDVSVTNGSPDADINLRGFKTDDPEKILIMVDGVEDNDLRTYIADISQQYPMSSIKRIEIIYGPSSTMYGTNAFSGVINIITKNAEDFFKNGRSFGISASAGMGSYNTKFTELNLGIKKGRFSFSMNGRLYESARPDLSSEVNWDYDPRIYDSVNYNGILKIDNPDSIAAFDAKYGSRPDIKRFAIYKYDKTNTDSIILIKPTDSAQYFAALYDKNGYNAVVNGVPVNKFINNSKSFYLSTRINLGDFTLGLVSWQKEEGSGTKAGDQTTAISGTVIRPLHNYLYFNYHKYFYDNKMLFTSLINYKIHTINNGSVNTNYYSYQKRFLTLGNLMDSVPSYWLPTYYFERSKQFRTELRLNYTPNPLKPTINLVSGLELKNSDLPAYLLTSNTSPVPEDYGNYAITTDSAGGNQLNVYDIGFYTQVRYRPGKIGYTLGGRIDYNKIKQNGGLGFTFSPRFVVDYKTSNWVFKTIFSKGILGISNGLKYNTTNRLVPNPTLQNQSIYNGELSVNKKNITKNLDADIVFYYSRIKDVIGKINIADKISQNVNVGEISVFGIQSNLYFTTTNKKFNAILNYSYTRSRQTLGDPAIKDSDFVTKVNLVPTNDKLNGIAPTKANAIFNYAVLNNKNLSLNLNMRFSYVDSKILGDYIADTSITLSPFFLSNFTLNVTSESFFKGGTIQLVCNNLFDKAYFSPGNFGISITPQARRNISFRILYEF